MSKKYLHTGNTGGPPLTLLEDQHFFSNTTQNEIETVAINIANEQTSDDNVPVGTVHESEWPHALPRTKFEKSSSRPDTRRGSKSEPGSKQKYSERESIRSRLERFNHQITEMKKEGCFNKCVATQKTADSSAPRSVITNLIKNAKKGVNEPRENIKPSEITNTSDGRKPTKKDHPFGQEPRQNVKNSAFTNAVKNKINSDGGEPTEKQHPLVQDLDDEKVMTIPSGKNIAEIL